MELKICISPQFRAIDPPNPARGFIQQNENVRFATAACMQKYGNVSFATVACAKCMRYGGRGGGPIPWGGGGGGGNTGHGTIYIYIFFFSTKNRLMMGGPPCEVSKVLVKHKKATCLRMLQLMPPPKNHNPARAFFVTKFFGKLGSPKLKPIH